MQQSTNYINKLISDPRMGKYRSLVLMLLVIAGLSIYGCENKKDFDYMQLAFEKNNISICKKIKEDYYQMKCQFEFLDRAEHEKDFPISLCKEVRNFGNIKLSNTSWEEGNLKDQCFQAAAVKKQDFALCGKIEDPFLKDKCIRAIEGEIAKKDFSYFNLALEENNISICKNITSDYIQFKCDYKFIKRVEHKEDFPIALCDEVKNFGSINLSVDEFESFRLGADIKLMGPLSEVGNIKDSCFLLAAVNKHNLSICKDIEDLTQKHDCIITTGITKNDSSVCQRFFDLEKNDCYFNFAYYQKDPKTCEKIDDQILKDSCYFQIAYVTHDYDLCDKVGYPTTRDLCSCHTLTNTSSEMNKCLQNFAKANQDVIFCYQIPLASDLIEDSRDAGICLGIVAREKHDSLICENTRGDIEANKFCIITYNVSIYGIGYCNKLESDYKKKCIELAS